ncbi:hypothetical protein C0993_010486 [Termitomyces sp. T159_Od127]|nr:hypothetical protein C0993_010486 [Termitomyces sp. T159_Od127]
MPGTKRTSPESDFNTRPSKAAKNSASQSTKKPHRKGVKRGRKARLFIICHFVLTISLYFAIILQPFISAETFKSIASPLHVNFTHMAPVNAEESEAASFDSGLIAEVILAPDTFSTGSFGWKGSKRVAIELPGSNTGKVQVMLTINATVVGSKPARAGETNGAAEEASSSESKED